MIDIIGTLRHIKQRVDNLFAMVNAILTLTETGGTVTTTGPGTEDVIYINAAPAGVFEPAVVQIDFTNQTAAETVVVRVYYRINPTVVAMVLKDEVAFVGLQDPELKNVDLEPNRFGVQVTIENTAGGPAIAYDWAVFKRD